MVQDSLTVHLVRDETRKIKHKREKTDFIGIWLEKIGGWKIGQV